MRLHQRSLLYILMAAILLSACTSGKTTPEVQPTSEGSPTEFAKQTAAPTDIVPIDIIEQITTSPGFAPTNDIQPTATPADVAHLGVPWADFSLRYDHLQWEVDAFDDDWPDLQALTHRTLAGCRVTPNVPVGLGEGWTIEERPKMLGQLELEVRSFYQNGALRFVGYYNFLNPKGDGAVEVHFVDNRETCIQAAEALLAATEVALP